MTLLEEVLGYAERDCPIIPLHSRAVNGGCTCEKSNCGSPAKHPRTPHGLKDATTDTNTIRRWWTRWPDANIGLATGRVSRLAVVDCDSQEAVNGFLSAYSEAAGTAQVETGRGRHFFFQWEAGIRNDAGRILGEGIDVRGEGGFVILPPSLHANGNRYRWLNESDPQPLPQGLRDALMRRTTGRDKSQRDSLERIKEGERNSTLTSLGGTMRRRRMSLQALEAALLVENAQKCDPPLPETEVRRIAESVSRYKPKEEAENSFPHYREQTVRKEMILQSWGEYVNSVPEAREYTVDGILPECGLVVCSGRGKEGKSTLIIHACRSIAAGEPFLDRPTIQKPVVYINYEMPPDYLGDLLGAADCPENAYIVDRPDPVLTLPTIKKLIEAVDSGSGMLVIDSFRGAFKLRGDAENSAGGAGVILRQLQDLAVKTGWLILVIHHSNRGGREGTDSISGTSDWIAAPDVIWTWQRPDPNKDGTLYVEGRIPPVDSITVKLSLEECNFTGTVTQSRHETEKQLVLETLSLDWKSTESIAAETGLPEATARKRLNSLYKERWIVVRDGEGKKGSPHRWRLRIIHSARGKPPSAETNSGANGHDPTTQEWPETDLMPTVWI